MATGGSEIRWFDARGGFIRRAGRAGEGPGEFRRIRYMRALAGDSLLVFDSNNRRVSILAPGGGYVRGENIRLREGRPLTVAGALRDGTLLTRTMLEAPPTSTPLYRVRMAFAIFRPDTTVSLREYLGQEAALHASGSGGGESSIFISVLPFARAVHAAAGPDHFFVGSSDSYQIDQWDGEGRPVRIIRIAAPVRPVTEEVREEYIARELDRSREFARERGRPFDEASVRRQLSELRYAPEIPAFGALFATADGGFWVSDFEMPGAGDAALRWTIFDSEGRLAGGVDLPPRFTPMYTAGTRVLGVYRDSLDVPYVQEYSVGRALVR